MLGLTLKKTKSIPVGSVIRKRMYQLDFEEWLMANGFGDEAMIHLKNCYDNRESLSQDMHRYVLSLFQRFDYLVNAGVALAVYMHAKETFEMNEEDLIF